MKHSTPHLKTIRPTLRMHTPYRILIFLLLANLLTFCGLTTVVPYQQGCGLFSRWPFGINVGRCQVKTHCRDSLGYEEVYEYETFTGTEGGAVSSGWLGQ